MKGNAWTYSDCLDSKRVTYLSEDADFSDVIEGIVDELRTVDVKRCCFRIDPGDHVKGMRPIFEVPISCRLGDIFFNGKNGYRAQYYFSPDHGALHNRLLIDQLTPYLIRVATAYGFEFNDKSMAESVVKQSVALPSAKIWSNENDTIFWEHVNDDVTEILAPRWVDNRNSQDANKKGKAQRGCHAPKLKGLRIFGAFVDCDGMEHISEHKRRRSCDLHECGWS